MGGRSREHTSCLSDWSSDVCSSDLPGFGSAQDVAVAADGSLHITGNVLTEPSGADAFVWNVLANGKGHDAAVWGGGDPFEGERGASIEIGSASCREGAETWEVAAESIRAA